jgi:threonine synthase
MHYTSTRGAPARRPFLDILLEGLAPDGGLYVPDHYPHFTPAELDFMRGMGYRDLAFTLLSRFCDDIPPEDLRDLIDKTYTAQTYGFGRADSDFTQITPVRPLAGEGEDVFILELSNGPTLAFKDMAMQLLGNLFEYALDKTGRDINILGATSGDTGSAAEYALRGKRHVQVFMLSPLLGMTRFQQAQMYSLPDANIHNIAIRGAFDPCQDIVKAASNDLAFKAQYRLGAVNSINWTRVVAQSVYYFKAYFAVTQNNAQKVSFAVPSGNFGNAYAGHLARQMGLPIHQLIAATNENDVLDECFRTGIYRPRKETQHTSSPSMDISKASNFERFAYDLCGRDSTKLARLWKAVDSGGAVDLKAEGLFDTLAELGFAAGRSDHAARISTIRRVWESSAVMIDPHTADGLNAGLPHKVAGVPLICLETALPAKFEDAMVEALGRPPERPAALANLEDLPQRLTTLDADAEAVKSFIAAHVGDRNS